MGIQNMGTAPARNQISAAAKPSKIKLPTGHPSTVTDDLGKAGATKGDANRGFTGNGTLPGKLKI